MPDILCMGEPMLELNRQPSGPDGRVLYLEGHGGDTSNAPIAAARNGASAGYITAIGQDGPGSSLMALWAREGVDSSTVLRDPDAPTGLYLVTHDERGHHPTFYRRGSAASRLRPRDVPEDAIRAARVLHVSGISQAISDSACDAVFHAIAAGDAFAGAFLARHVAGDDPFAAARYANAAAALTTTGYGAVAPIPRPAAVEALLREQSGNAGA